MGAYAWMETCIERRGVRTFCASCNLPHFCCGWTADGNYFRDFLRATSRNGLAARGLWCTADAADLVLYGADGLASFGHSRSGDVERGRDRVVAETSRQSDELAFCGRTDHPDLATATTLSSRFSTLFFRGVLHFAGDADFAGAVGTRMGARSTPAGVAATPLAELSACARSIRWGSSNDLFRSVDRFDPTGRI